MVDVRTYRQQLLTEHNILRCTTIGETTRGDRDTTDDGMTEDTTCNRIVQG